MRSIIFYYLITINIMFCICMDQGIKELPSDITKKISSLFFLAENTLLPLQKFNPCDQSNCFEQLYFPSSSPVFFLNLLDYEDVNLLFKLQKDCFVLPHIQLWVGLRYKKVRIDNDMYRLRLEYRCDDASCKDLIFYFDEYNQTESEYKVVVIQMNFPTGTLCVRDLKKSAQIDSEYVFNSIKSAKKLYDYPLSFSYHNNPDWFCSVIIKKKLSTE